MTIDLDKLRALELSDTCAPCPVCAQPVHLAPGQAVLSCWPIWTRWRPGQSTRAEGFGHGVGRVNHDGSQYENYEARP